MRVYFFIGTEAEFIKVFPIMLELKKQKIAYSIIASGQNDIMSSRLMDVVGKENVLVELSREEEIKKSTVGLLTWWIKVYRKAMTVIQKEISKEKLSEQILVVHGDTVSTMMGAILGHRLRMKVMHVEAGLRSHNYFNPFPEEIDRMITSHFARFHMAPGRLAVENLKNAKGTVVNTEYNTIYDSLMFSKQMPFMTSGLEEILEMKYGVFVMHRQENLMNRQLVSLFVDKILEKASKVHCVIVMHEITRVHMEKYELLKKLQNHPNIHLVPRMQYFDFMKVLQSAEFVVTDGGSNQEELYLMGKPCLIMRESTERQDGIGSNALMWEGKRENIELFFKDYLKYKKEPLILEESPAVRIVKEIKKIYGLV